MGARVRQVHGGTGGALRRDRAGTRQAQCTPGNPRVLLTTHPGGKHTKRVLKKSSEVNPRREAQLPVPGGMFPISQTPESGC